MNSWWPVQQFVIKGFLVSLGKPRRLWVQVHFIDHVARYHPLRDFFHLLGFVVKMKRLPVGGTQWRHSGAILQLSQLLLRVRSHHLFLPEALRERSEERLELEIGRWFVI